VICYLPCFGEWLITRLLSAFLPFLCLFTNCSETSSLLLPLSPMHFRSCPLCCSTRLQFTLCYSVVFWRGGHSAQGLC
jgi:hypothetical protein